MEYFDVLDEKGNKTGKVKLRADVHRDGDWHRSVHVWIVNPNKEVLLQKRSSNKDSHPNRWNMASGGHLKAGESSLATAIEETWEEIGLKLTKNEMKLIFSCKSQNILNNGIFIDNEFNDVYLVRRDLNVGELIINKEEISEMKFMLFDDYLDEQKRSNKKYIIIPQDYLEMLAQAIELPEK